MRTLYRARLVHTLAYPTTGEWLLTDGRHVQRVGSGDPPQADRVVELPGATIVPGFVDTHVHLTSTGQSLGDEAVVAATSADELLELARARRAEGRDPVVLSGFDETRWEDPTHPSLDDLDRAVPDAPLVIYRADGHVALANTAAVDGSGVGGEEGVERTPGGTATGRLTQRAVAKLGRWLTSSLSDHEIQELQLKGAAVAAAHGVTSIHEMQMPHEYGLRDLQVLLGHRERLPVDALPIVATMDLPLAIDHGFSVVGGDLPVDGSIGARTAAVSVPYVDGAGEGTAYYEDDELLAFFSGGHAAGLQVGVHAIGDRGIEQVVATWERVYGTLDSRQRRHFRARRHRIEHFEMASTDVVERAAMLGLAVSVQPTFDRYWGQPGGLYEVGLGWDRAEPMNPFRTMIDRGVEIGAGSDAPITPLDPLLTVDAMEHHHSPSQRLGRAEAIRLHTVGSARLGHQEEKKGALAPGMHADFVAFGDDPFDAPELVTLAPILTVSLGREVFVG